jgi:hypothetical protein
MADDNDELGQRRSDKDAGEAVASAMDAISASMDKKAQEFADWLKDTMPVHEFSHQAHSFSNGIVGSLVGAWIDAGATREQVKEYLTRFTDFTFDRYEAIQPYMKSS